MKLWSFSAICVAGVLALLLPALPAAAQEDAPEDEGTVEVHSKTEKKVEYSFSYYVKTHGFVKGDAARKGAKPAKKVKAAKDEPAPDEKPAETPKPSVNLDVKGGKLTFTRANILVNRNLDLGVTMDVFGQEVRLSEFVKMTRDDIDVHFDIIDVISTLGGIAPGDYTLVYFDVDGKEAFNGKFTVK